MKNRFSLQSRVGFGGFLLSIITFKYFVSYRTVANSAIAKCKLIRA